MPWGTFAKKRHLDDALAPYASDEEDEKAAKKAKEDEGEDDINMTLEELEHAKRRKAELEKLRSQKKEVVDKVSLSAEIDKAGSGTDGREGAGA